MFDSADLGGAAGSDDEGLSRLSSVRDGQKEAEMRMRQERARRQARSAAGMSRAESLRLGLELRSAHTVIDFLTADDILGPAGSTAGSSSAAPSPSFVCIDALAKSFGLGPARSSPETDEDRAHLKKLAQRMDPAAQRALLYHKPAEGTRAAVLSSLLVDDDAYVQRFALTTDAGEETVITLVLKLEERLAPDYKSATIFEQWVVDKVTGEPADLELPRRPDRRNSPEGVVAAQLAALQAGDAAQARVFASPRNVAASGPLALFKRMLASPAYAPLSEPNARIETLKTAQLSKDAYVELVQVTRKSTGVETTYLWVLGRQPESGCWMTDAVTAVEPADLVAFGL